MQAGVGMVDQMEEIKTYVDKKVKRLEVVCTKREEVEKIEEKQEEFERQTNLIFEAIKDMVGELSRKVKGFSKDIDEKIERQVQIPIYEKRHNVGGTQVKELGAETVVKAGREEKLKSLDALILKVSSLIDKKQVDEKERAEIVIRVQRTETLLENKADKTKVCDLLDRKAETVDVNKALIDIHSELDKYKSLLSGGQALLAKSSSHTLPEVWTVAVEELFYTA